VNGKLVVASVPEPDITLEKLLSDVNERNLHREVPMSPDTESEE
jgi:SOS-response transcriptional repressor LexA